MDSICVCTKSSDEFQNTLTRYSIRPEQLIENATEKLENYDLMSVGAIYLGKLDSENYTSILKFFRLLLIMVQVDCGHKSKQRKRKAKAEVSF